MNAAMTLDLSAECLDRHFPQTVIALPSGAAVAVRAAGDAVDAPAVVLLHGIGSGAASWLGVATALADSARVLAWDAPGYGDSTPLSQPVPSAADYAARLDEVLGALHVDRCVLVGHSLGAMMVAAHASGPGRARVRRLVLLNPARGYGAPERAAERARVRAARLGALGSRGIAAMATEAPDRMLTPAASDAARGWVAWNTARLNPAGYTQAVEMLCADDIFRAAPLQVACEVHCGDADIVTPPETCRAIAQALNASFDAIPRAGHASPVERPDHVAELLARIAAKTPTP